MNVMHISGDNSSVSQGVTTFPAALGGGVLAGTTTEGRAQYKVASPGVASNFFAFLSANTLSVTHTDRIRIGGANGNSVLSIATTLTGQFEDGSNTDTFDDNELVCYSLSSAAGSGSVTVQSAAHLFAPTTGTVNYVGRMGAGITSTADCAIGYVAEEIGSNIAAATTEAHNQNTIGASFTLQNMNVNSDSNTRSDTIIMRNRINGTNANMSISVTSGTTGQLEDTSNTDSVVADDEAGFWFEQGGGSGNFACRTQKIEFSGSNVFPMFCSAPVVNNVTGLGATDLYMYPVGTLLGEFDSTEANQQAKANVAFTWSEAHFYLSENSKTTDSAGRSRINSGTGNILVTLTASTTGLFSDTSNSDSVADDDEFNYLYSAGSGAGTLRIRHISSVGSGAAGSDISTINGLALASVSTYNGLAIASVSSVNGVAN